MTFRVLISDALAKEGVDVFATAKDLDVVNRAGMKRDELLKAIGEFDALVVRSATEVDAEVIAAGTRLKVVGRAGIGVDNVDLRASTRAGVVVMNTPEGNATTTAEHAIAMMFAMARMIPQATASMKAGKWEKSKFMGRELCGKTLGIIGLGNIGRIVADRALGLRLKVVGFDPFLDAAAASKFGVELLPLDEVIRRADIITVHTPLNEQTRGLIGDAQIEVMRPGVLIINCARGGIYDEAALLRGLGSGKIGGVALDVFMEEPPAAGNPLIGHERVICTPHLGASTKEAQVQVSVAIAEQVIDFARGEPARNAVNLPRVSASDLKLLGPALDLAQRIGSFCEQVSRGNIKRIAVHLTGELAERSPGMLTTAAVAGALQGAFSRPVNFVNARVVAAERGVQVVESRAAKAERGYAHTMTVTVEATEESHTVTGTVFGSGEGRLVEVDGTALEAVPEGYLLFIRNHDRPGVIGHIGTVLGHAGINISRMHLGIVKDGGGALSIVSINKPAPAEVLEQLRTADVIWLHQVRL